MPLVIYVDILDVQTNYEYFVAAGYIENTFVNFLTAYMSDATMTQASPIGNEYIKEQILNALTITCEHIYDDECVDTTCNRCCEERVAPGHSFTNYVSDGNATCTEDGTKTAKCDRCDVTDTVADEGSALGHNFVAGTCTVCGAKDPNYVPPVHIHTEVIDEAVAPTCT